MTSDCSMLSMILRCPDADVERATVACRRHPRGGGERRNEVMSIAAKPLSDDDIRDLATYYAAIQIEVRALPQ